MPKLTDEQIIGIVNQEFDESIGRPGGDVAVERAEEYDFYLSRPFGDEEEGYSKVVTSDVSDAVDSIMESILPIFTTAENLVSFDPVGPEDEEAAQQESDYVNYVFFKQNDAFGLLYQGIFDALVQKNGIYQSYWDETEEITTETYEGLSEGELLDLLADDEVELVERDERQAETVDDAGNIVFATVHDIKIARTSKTGQVRVDSVPPEEYRISNDASWLDPSSARFVGREREVTRDELIRMGFGRKLVESLGADADTIESPEELARKNTSDESQTHGGTADESQDRLILREGYLRVDADGDGKSELKQIFSVRSSPVGGKKDARPIDKMLSIEDFDSQPFSVICPHPLPHKHFGRSTADKVMDVQLFNSHFMRQIFDNLYQTNRPGHAVYSHAMGENTMDQLLTATLGRVVEFDRPVGESWSPITVPFTAKDTFPLVEYFDKVKRDRTGVSADSEALSPDSLKHIQTTVASQMLEKGQKKPALIARVFAETGFKHLFRRIHELVRKHQQKAEYVKLRGKWVPVDPREWRTRKNMTVNIGLGIGTREQNLIHLEAIWQKQAALLEAGWGFMVQPQNVFRTVSEFVKNANLKVPDLYFSNPGNAEAPPPNREQLQLQQQQQQLVAREQQQEQRRQQLDAQKQQLEREKMLLEHQRQQAEIRRKAEADADKFRIENEKLRNELVEFRLKYGQEQTSEARGDG